MTVTETRDMSIEAKDQSQVETGRKNIKGRRK
jgi:hypothetical protein